MAVTPVFASVPRTAVAAVSTANTNRDGTGTIATIFTAGSSGSKVNEIVLAATGDPADSVVVLYLHDGSTAWDFDEVDLGNPAAGSTTVSPYRVRRFYDNLNLPNGWSIRGSITVALTAGVVNIFAHGGDY